MTAAQPRRIWLCADDFCISDSVDIAIRDLVVRGRLNAASVLVVAPSFHRSEAISLDALNAVAPRVAIGLHVALTAPFPPSSKGFAPVREGAFLPLAATFRHAVMRRFEREMLVAEIAGQVRTFVETFGRAPDFVDGHQHVHLLPQISDAFLEVVKETAPNAWVRQCGRALPFAARFADRKALLLDVFSSRFRRAAAAMGVRTNPAFAGAYDFNDDADVPTLFARFLDGLPDGGVVMCHPGFVDAQLRRLDPLTTLREKEYAFLAGDAFPALLASRGVALA
ncbi:MAG: ChbG/HpnK family deacetylase [Xanthobacteraceae bacterium]